METGELQAMETVMLGDRIRGRAKEKEMVVYDGVTHWNEDSREENILKHVEAAYRLGKSF